MVIQDLILVHALEVACERDVRYRSHLGSVLFDLPERDAAKEQRWP